MLLSNKKRLTISSIHEHCMPGGKLNEKEKSEHQKSVRTDPSNTQDN